MNKRSINKALKEYELKLKKSYRVYVEYVKLTKVQKILVIGIMYSAYRSTCPYKIMDISIKSRVFDKETYFDVFIFQFFLYRLSVCLGFELKGPEEITDSPDRHKYKRIPNDADLQRINEIVYKDLFR